MKTKLLLFAVAVAAFTSCSTMYKTGQTPDDVYYSPARPFYDEAQTDTKKDDRRNEQQYVYNSDERMIRMGIADSRWRYLNYDYCYSPYNYYDNRFNSLHGFYGSSNYYGNYGNYYNSNFNNVYFNDYYYNPFYSPYPVYMKPATLLKNSTPRVTNLNGYGHNNYNNSNAPLMSIPAPRPVRNYNNSNRSSGLGNVLDKVLSPSSNNNSNSNNTRSTTTERTYTPPPASNSKSSSGSSSSGASGSRISRPN